MELFHILKSVIFHHPGGFRPHSPENNSSIFYLEFFRNRFKINGVGIKHGEGLARADSYTECSSPIQVLKLEENDLLENKNPSCHDYQTNQCQEGPALPFQLFKVQSFLCKITDCSGVVWNRGPTGLGHQAEPSCFLMHSHQLRFALEESLHHIIDDIAL